MLTCLNIADVRHIPDSEIKVDLPVWSWTEGKPGVAPKFTLPCILAFAANRKIIQYKFDGVIGLSVPTCVVYSHLSRGHFLEYR